MKIMKGLMVATATLVLSSLATAAPASDASLTSVKNIASQMRVPFDEQRYCRENPRDCYCTYIGGRKYCFIL